MKLKRDKEQLFPYNQVAAGNRGKKKKKHLFSYPSPSNQEKPVGGWESRVGSANGVETSVEFKALSATFCSCESGY